MLFKNIKILLLGCLATISSATYCWNNVIKNDTDGEIVVTIDYAAPGICSPENRIIPARGEVAIDSKICCAQTVTIRATNGTVSGQSYSFDTPRAGLNMTCSNFKVRVYIATNKTLMAEANLF